VRGVSKFLQEVVGDLWINGLNGADTFYMKVTTLQTMDHLDANSGGMHAIDMVTLQSSMPTYYEYRQTASHNTLQCLRTPRKRKNRQTCPSWMPNWS
jgi:hypothetical protein